MHIESTSLAECGHCLYTITENLSGLLFEAGLLVFMIVSTSHVDRKIDFAEGEEERADRERIYRALGDFGGRRGMEGGDQAESVQHFCAVTAATPEQARFFLESCAWQLETAIHSFFENDAGPVPTSPQDYDEQREEEEEDEDDDDEYLPATEASRTGTSAATTVPAPVVVAGTGQNRRGSLSTRPTQGTGSFGAASGGSRPKPGKEKAVARSNGGRGGITTLSDLNKHPDSDSDSDGPQEYYTGGEKRYVICALLVGLRKICMLIAKNYMKCRCSSSAQYW